MIESLELKRARLYQPDLFDAYALKRPPSTYHNSYLCLTIRELLGVKNNK